MSNKKVLIIESHIILWRRLKALLEGAGYDVSVARNEETARHSLSIGNYGAVILGGSVLSYELRARVSEGPEEGQRIGRPHNAMLDIIENYLGGHAPDTIIWNTSDVEDDPVRTKALEKGVASEHILDVTKDDEDRLLDVLAKILASK